MFQWLSILPVKTTKKKVEKNVHGIFSGDIDDDINFEYESNTEVYQSCATTLDGEMWVLGGYYKRRQVNITC